MKWAKETIYKKGTQIVDTWVSEVI